MKLKNFNTIAVLQTAFIGDTMLSLFFIDHIKQINPDAKLIFITLEKYKDILQLSNSIDEIIYFDKKNKHKKLKDLISFSKSLKQKNIDLFISLHRSVRSTILCKFSNPKQSITFNESALSFLYSKRVKQKTHLHEINKNEEILKSFDDYSNFKLNENSKNPLQNKQNKIDLDFSQINTEKIDSLFPSNTSNNKNIILAPGSVWDTKKWPKQQFKELNSKLSDLGYNIFIIGGEEDIQLSNYIKSNTNSIITAGNLNLAESLYLIKKSHLIISNDSAPIHLASLVNTPTIAIFGPTDPIFGFSPLADYSITVYNENLNCRPCEIHGSNSCPLGTHECMKSITPEQILGKVERLFYITNQ